MKVVAATTLCLGLFGVAFLGVNNFALAASTAEPQPLQFVETVANITASNVVAEVPEEYRKPDMALNVVFVSDAVPSVNAMSPEAAAEIGAQYIWDVFGESIDGKTIHMIYRSHPAMVRDFWTGIVTDTVKEDLCGEGLSYLLNNALFEFTVDSVTGKRIDLKRAVIRVEMSDEVREAVDAIFSCRSNIEAQIALRGGTIPADITDAYYQAAREFAQRHFIATDVVSVELMGSVALGFDFDGNGNLVRTEFRHTFDVTDCTGRIASVAINENTKQLHWIHTSTNDIVPGFRYVSDEPGIG